MGYTTCDHSEDHIRRDVFNLINLERDRQDMKWGSQRHLSDQKWAVILGEEYGEACKEVLEVNDAKLFTELVQVAAVVTCWLEALIVKRRNCGDGI